MKHLTHEGNLLLNELVREVSSDPKATDRETLLAAVIIRLMDEFAYDMPVRELV